MEQGLIKMKSIEKQSVDTSVHMKQLEQKGVFRDFAKEKKLLRTPRTKKYIKLIKEIDHLNEKDKEIIEMVQSLPVNNKLLGILSECGITGCVIHAIDKWGNILAHFRCVDEMNADLQAGYHIFLQHDGCASVEVYTHTFCIIYEDGTVKFIEREI